MKKIFHSIEISRYRDTEKKSPMNNITTPRFSLNPLNHPRPRFLSYSVMPILLSLLAGLFVLTACEEETAAPKKDRPPIITAIEDQTVQAGGSSITVNITASDPDGEIPSLDYSPELPYASLTSTGNGTADLLFEPDRNVSPGTTTITITASSDGLNDTETFTLTITDPEDRPPIITAIEDQTVQAGGSSITVNITASDPDGEIPTLSYSPILPYATLTTNDNGTADLLFAPKREVSPVTTNITITATSDGLTDTETFTLTVTDPEDRPPIITAIKDQTVQADGTPLELSITATDPDGQTPTLSYSPILPYATLTNNGNGTADLVFDPGRDVSPGETTIIITATSAGLTDTETFTLTITDPPDRPPLITAIGDQTVPAGSSLIVRIVASDPDLDQTPTLSYSPELPYATLSSIGNGTADLLFEPGRNVSPGETTITITATSAGLTDTETFTLTIADPLDRAPTIDSITPNPVAVRAGETNRVTVTASDPDAGETPTLSLDGTGPGFVSIAENRNGSATIIIRPEAGEPPDTITINVVATSGNKAITNDFILIIASLSAVDGDGDGVLDIVDVDDDNDGLIEINSLEDLDNIRYNLEGTSYKTSAADPDNMNGAPGSGLNGYELVRGLDFNDPASYASGMVNTAWTMGSGWLPIGDNSTGDDSTRFTGILEGNGHKITNLMISRDIVYIGLFGYIGMDGEVRNLGLENGVADYTGNSGKNRYIGLLAGESRGRIIAVHTSGIADGGNHNEDRVGGLVGRNNRGAIMACHATGNADGGDGTDHVGGLVGENTLGTITACYATGNATGGSGLADRVGGLVGQNSGTITACHATGMADGGSGDGDRVGGLVGRNSSTITACYATGNPADSGGVGDRVGGLVGENRNTITACYATGNAGGDSSDHVGGLVGENRSTITACYATGNATGGSGLADRVGGLVGFNNTGTITACYATGNANGGMVVTTVSAGSWG